MPHEVDVHPGFLHAVGADRVRSDPFALARRIGVPPALAEFRQVEHGAVGEKQLDVRNPGAAEIARHGRACETYSPHRAGDVADLFHDDGGGQPLRGYGVLVVLVALMPLVALAAFARFVGAAASMRVVVVMVGISFGVRHF